MTPLPHVPVPLEQAPAFARSFQSPLEELQHENTFYDNYGRGPVSCDRGIRAIAELEHNDPQHVTDPGAGHLGATQKTPDTTRPPNRLRLPRRRAPSTSTGAPQARTTAPAPSTTTSQSCDGEYTADPGADRHPDSTGRQPGAAGSRQRYAEHGRQQPAQRLDEHGRAAGPAPASANTAQSPSTNVNASVNINDQQRTRVTQSISRLNVQPLTTLTSRLTVGTSVPRDVRLQTLPSDVVEVVPQYRGYNFFVVRDEIVIVEPSTFKS